MLLLLFQIEPAPLGFDLADIEDTAALASILDANYKSEPGSDWRGVRICAFSEMNKKETVPLWKAGTVFLLLLSSCG